jgi:oligogalacturonide transporter
MKKKDGIFAKIAYGSGDIYGGGSFLIVGVLFLAFLTNVEGLSGTLAGVIVFIGKAWDAVTDPLMGILSDRTKSKFGRRRIYFLFGSIPVFISWVMLWYSFGIPDSAAKFIYYTVAFMFFSTAFTVVMIPYNSILSDMVKDYDKRSAFTGVRLSFSAGTAIICAVVPAMITGAFENQKTGYLVMAALFAIVFGVCWLIVFSGTWENTMSSGESGFTLKDWLSVFKNRSFNLYVRIFVLSQMAIDITMALAVYYLGVSLRKDRLFIPAMAAILIVQLVFIAIFSAVAQKYSKKTPALIAALVWITANAFIFIFTRQTPDLIILITCSLIGVGAAGCNLVSWSTLPDIADVDELMTGKRREGLYSGVSTFLRKLSGGIAVGSVGLLLDAFRYSDDAVKSGNIDPVTDMGVKLMFCVLPAIFLIAMLFTLKKYMLGKKEFAVMQKVLDVFRSNGKSLDVDSSSVSICEQLTGVNAESLYGKQGAGIL